MRNGGIATPLDCDIPLGIHVPAVTVVKEKCRDCNESCFQLFIWNFFFNLTIRALLLTIWVWKFEAKTGRRSQV